MGLTFGLLLLFSACGGGGGGGGNSPVTSGNSGTLTLANAPLDMQGELVADARSTSASVVSTPLNYLTIGWAENPSPSSTNYEVLELNYELDTGISHVSLVDQGDSTDLWSCGDPTVANSLCTGITVDKIKGTVTFTDQVLVSNASSPITLNGVLKFTPPSGL